MVKAEGTHRDTCLQSTLTEAHFPFLVIPNSVCWKEEKHSS